MNEGRIQQLGTTTTLLFKPANNFVQTFLDPQRLQLELKSLLLQDLWPFLITKDNPAGLQQLPAESSCWEALEAITHNPVAVVYRQEQKEIDGSTLMDAIASYKKQ
jgi:osmoprotectant transport system ATP-binding protein